MAFRNLKKNKNNIKNWKPKRKWRCQHFLIRGSLLVGYWRRHTPSGTKNDFHCYRCDVNHKREVHIQQQHRRGNNNGGVIWWQQHDESRVSPAGRVYFYFFSFEKKITKREEDSRSTLDNERVHLDAFKKINKKLFSFSSDSVWSWTLATASLQYLSSLQKKKHTKPF